MFPSQNIEELKKEFVKKKSMALFLGSGIDMTNTYPKGEKYQLLLQNNDYKLTWDNLLTELVNAASINNEERKALNSFNSNTFKAAFLKQRLGESYIPIIQNWLYTRCNRSVLLKSYEYFRQYQDQSNYLWLKEVPFGTLFAIADIILKQESIRVVFTQNYNNFLSEAIRILLEKNPNNYSGRRNCIPVDVYDGWKEEPFDVNHFLIYHVHGYIPPYYEMIPKKESNHIVLSDEEFYNLSRDVFSWQNVTQLHYLTHYTCIIAGLSLDDMTMLRLLRHARLDRSSEKVYWLRGGEGSDDGRLAIQASYYESQFIHVVNDAQGYASLYHQLMEVAKSY
ncbi:MAG: SIR2 family protein [Bacteroidales bacterium]|nr:SIR2 family protein [Bacteroidales bacterium]